MSIEDSLAALRGMATPELPQLGTHLYEALRGILDQQQNIAQQTNSNPEGPPSAPPPINSLSVQSQNGHFSVSIQDSNQIYRGVKYYVEHDTDPKFSNPQTVDLGDSRNMNKFLGSEQHYFRAYSAYPASAASSHVYHGTQNAPTPVAGGGSIGSPAYLPSQSSGTGVPGQGGPSGPGQIPYRSITGAPPLR